MQVWENTKVRTWKEDRNVEMGKYENKWEGWVCGHGGNIELRKCGITKMGGGGDMGIGRYENDKMRNYGHGSKKSLTHPRPQN